ncbi:hypothetical protein [Terrabacter carboxydivorans]|uniref:Uncharacterized protein n=1 Tax=Terrabacter carboxydivorans TaxID=619730 RepID=A0ABN3MHT0_9MICO
MSSSVWSALSTAPAVGGRNIAVRAHLPRGGAEAEPVERTVVVLEADDNCLVLPEAVVIDPLGIPSLDSLASTHPAGGGGPLAGMEDRRRAREYGVGNAAWHVQRGLRYVASLLERPLPVLTVRLNAHGADWGGGHYRLPAAQYSELIEPRDVASAGEVHLGAGRRYLPIGAGRYFAAPSHNAAIIYHELGHHVCRHTADFRGNRHRDPAAQTNLRTGIEEGTCDYLAAVLLGTPDIYGWHRGDRSDADPRRRRLDTVTTMAAFRGGRDVDPHLDGTVWATALWSARLAWQACRLEGAAFDAALLRALDHLGQEVLSADPAEWTPMLRRRRYFSTALAALLDEAQAQPGAHAGVSAVETAFAERGVVVGQSNAALREAARR